MRNRVQDLLVRQTVIILYSYLFFNTQVSSKLISKIGGIDPVLIDFEVINNAGQDEARNDRLACLARLQIQDTG